MTTWGQRNRLGPLIYAICIYSCDFIHSTAAQAFNWSVSRSLCNKKPIYLYSVFSASVFAEANMLLSIMLIIHLCLYGVGCVEWIYWAFLFIYMLETAACCWKLLGLD